MAKPTSSGPGIGVLREEFLRGPAEHLAHRYIGFAVAVIDGRVEGDQLPESSCAKLPIQVSPCSSEASGV